MQSLTDEGLARRTEHIVFNCYIINERGQIALDSEAEETYYWMDRITEQREEMLVRKMAMKDIQHLLDPVNIPRSLCSSGAKAAFQLRPSSGLKEGFLFRYSKAKYLEASLQNGTFRLKPASSYNDSSLNNAVRDDELCVEISYDPFLVFRNEHPATLRRKQIKAQSDYYALCMSSQLANRIMLDFESDACLVIREPKVFFDRFVYAAKERLRNWHFELKKVEYFDPLLASPKEIDLIWSKHFRYAYQKEIRLACVPPTPVSKVEHFDLSIGSLEDIAEIVLPTSSE